MKVTCLDQAINSWVKELEVEVEGETYRITLNFDWREGFQMTFMDKEGKVIDSPDWVDNYPGGEWKLESDLNDESGDWNYEK